MAKITRLAANYLAFALNALAGERTVFNSAVDSDTLDANVTADFLRGWGIVGASEFPTKQDFNAAFFTLGQTLAYLHQTGVAEWDILQEYFIGSFTVGSDGNLYRSFVGPNTGTDPVGDVSGDWKRTGFAWDELTAAFEPVLTVASQIEMETGTEVALRSMSPLRVAQAAAATPPTTVVSTTKLEQEAGTVSDKAVTPSVQQHHPSASKAWVNFDGAGLINSSYNIASVVRNAAGNYTITFTIAFANANYVWLGSARDSDDSHAGSGRNVFALASDSKTAGALQIHTGEAGTNIDSAAVSVVFFGE